MHGSYNTGFTKRKCLLWTSVTDRPVLEGLISKKGPQETLLLGQELYVESWMVWIGEVLVYDFNVSSIPNQAIMERA